MYESTLVRTRMHGSSAVGYANVFTPPTAISSALATSTRGYAGVRWNADRARIHKLPASMPKLVKVRNLVNCRRFTYRSSAVKTENSSRQSGVLEGLRNQLILPLPCVIGHIDRDIAGIGRRHHVHLGRDFLVSEPERVHRLFPPRCRNRFRRHVGQRLAGA